VTGIVQSAEAFREAPSSPPPSPSPPPSLSLFGRILEVVDEADGKVVLVGWDDRKYEAMWYSAQQALGPRGLQLWNGGGRRSSRPN